LSSLIVSGQITREVALKELEQPLYDDRELEEDKQFIAKKLSLDLKAFNDLLELPNRDYTGYPNQEKILGMFRAFKSKIIRK